MQMREWLIPEIPWADLQLLDLQNFLSSNPLHIFPIDLPMRQIAPYNDIQTLPTFQDPSTGKKKKLIYGEEMSEERRWEMQAIYQPALKADDSILQTPNIVKQVAWPT